MLCLQDVFDIFPHLHLCVDELASLEGLHLWRTTRVHADLFEFVYASRFHVHIPCAKFKPLMDRIRIAKTKEMPLILKDQFPRLTDLTVNVAQQRLASSSSDLNIKQVTDLVSRVQVAKVADLCP